MEPVSPKTLEEVTQLERAILPEQAVVREYHLINLHLIMLVRTLEIPIMKTIKKAIIMVLVHLESPEVGIRGMVLVQETVMESVPEVVIVQGLDGVRQQEQVKQTELLRPMDLHGEYPVEVLKAILQEHPKVFQRDRVLLTAKDYWRFDNQCSVTVYK